jgi:hypothetical protein
VQHHFRGRGSVAKGAVVARGVVVDPRALDQDPGIAQTLREPATELPSLVPKPLKL